MLFSKPNWKDFYRGIEKEWLITNGIGGFASSTIINANTRRYHGLLIASLHPPVQRYLTISKMDETITIDDKEYCLHSNQTPDYIGEGYKYLQKVEVGEIPTFIYNIGEVFVEKRISMIYGKNSVAVVYTVKNGTSPITFKIYPLVNFRDYHENSYKNNLEFTTYVSENGVLLKPKNFDVNIEIRASEGKFSEQATWFYNMDYMIERERGLNSIEDHYIPGVFEISLEPNQEKIITIIGSTDNIDSLDGMSIIQNEKKRVKELLDKVDSNDDFINMLTASADKFIVHRESTDSKTILAGFPWFSDWGRDTMIALPGLTLLTKRFDDAKEIINTFAKYVKNGLIPNMFPDSGQEPIYNTVDASLWFFEAVYKYLRATKEYNYVKENIYPKFKEIIDAYKNGTDFNISMDNDGLISAGSNDIQLTWMDAKIGDWVVTPRQGKAVEINALWYNALKIMSLLARKYGDNPKLYDSLALKVKASFEKFWSEENKCLCDIITNDYKDEKIRPNQLIAISLSHAIVDEYKAKLILERVFKELYVTLGIRSLSQKDTNYIGKYYGDQYKRDSSYHQGTAWSWLIGPFIGSYLKLNSYSKESKDFCLNLLEPFKIHIMDAGLGSISEIFDGDEPNQPRGCFAQAWGVAEVLRAYMAAKGKEKY